MRKSREGPGVLAVLDVREFTHKYRESLFHEVVDIRLLREKKPHPPPDQRRVQVNELAAGVCVDAVASLLEQAMRRVG
jgi:hypothetical protein